MHAEMKQVLLDAFSFSDVYVAASNTSEGLEEMHNLFLNRNVLVLSVFLKKSASLPQGTKHLKFTQLSIIFKSYLK